MAVYSLKAVQHIPASLPAVWSFFSNPDNLKEITPSYLGFTVLSKHHSEPIYAGQLIEYTIRPMLRLPLYWMTEITHLKDQQYFVDEQRYGPYSLWHHQHHFKPIENGIEMTDIVHYKIPFWVLGQIANTLFVRKQLQELFIYRYHKTVETFGAWPQGRPSLKFY